MENNTAFDEILAAFIANSQDKINLEYRTSPLPPPILITMPGKKYVRIVRQEIVSRSAWAFVDIATGDILKAASWAAPAKHARANIYQPVTWDNVSAYGPCYLR
jgi:hypothetical protein